MIKLSRIIETNLATIYFSVAGLGLGLAFCVGFGGLMLKTSGIVYICSLLHSVVGSSVCLMLVYTNRSLIRDFITMGYFRFTNYLVSVNWITILTALLIITVGLVIVYHNYDYLYCMDELVKNLEFAKEDEARQHKRWLAAVDEQGYHTYDLSDPAQAARKAYIDKILPDLNLCDIDAHVRTAWAEKDIEDFKKASVVVDHNNKKK